MKPETEKFIKKILFEQIHAEERYDSSEDLCENARWLAKYKRQQTDAETPYTLYIKLGLRINHLKQLLDLCAYLKSIGFDLQYTVKVDEFYYESCFKSRIEYIRKLMYKLRPFVLTYVRNWSQERKQSDIDNEFYGTYFKTWYI